MEGTAEMNDLFDEVVTVLNDADNYVDNLEKHSSEGYGQALEKPQAWSELDDFDRQVMNEPVIEDERLWCFGAPRYSSASSCNPYTLQTKGNSSLKAVSRPQPPQTLVGKMDISQLEYGSHIPRRGNDSSPIKSNPILYKFHHPYKTPVNKMQMDVSRAEAENVHLVLPEERRSDYPLRRAIANSEHIAFSHDPPIVRGIPLISVNSLPDRFRGVFAFPLFNAVQSGCFRSVYESNNNIVLSSPTGSGKTAILELAICALVNQSSQGNFKVIYQAPTKALCAERQRDWERKFATLGLACTELTGDTQQAQLRNVKNGDIIITTPEKWDSMTRKWEDHKKLLELVRLFLIDEVHILKEARGATLEVVVSRMKSTGLNVRFVALSATIPNSADIAAWLGKDSQTPSLSACDERFGEEFRPVKLQRFVYEYPSTGNDFMFDKTLDKMLPGIIQKHSARKPVMIFCMTRAVCVSTARMLAEKWKELHEREKYWPPPNRSFSFKDKDLQTVGSCGVAFHHAGLDSSDRALVERLFLETCLHVICCTSTLAVGVNLPTHLVVIKNTVTWADGQTKEYVDLEVMQMLGRAGRPQFDDTAVAVIMTKRGNKLRHEKIVSGTETLESCLHENLVEHLNAEIGLGTIKDVGSAKLWLQSTFFYVRLKLNPAHYKLDQQVGSRYVDRNLEEICEKNIHLLEQIGLVSSDKSRLKCSELGDAMARYYIKFKTMQMILGMEKKAKIREVLLTLSQAEEFKDIRFRSGEKGLYKELNKAVKYPVKFDLSSASHKTFILLQFEIGMVEFPAIPGLQKYKQTLLQDKNLVFQHCHRVIRCIIDCQLHFRDSVSVKSSLEIARCLKAKAWENSPLQLRQIEGFGPASIKKLVNAGVSSLQMLEQLEPHKIEAVMSRNPPFGSKVLKAALDIPKLRVLSHQVSKSGNRKDPVKLNVRTEIGYLNDRVSGKLRGMTLFANFFAERSDGLLIEFRRIPVSKLEGGKEIKFTVELETSSQTVICHLVCEDTVGTLKTHELKPDVESSLYPPQPIQPPPLSSIAPDARLIQSSIAAQGVNHHASLQASEKTVSQVPLALNMRTLNSVNSAHENEDVFFPYMDDFDMSDFDDTAPPQQTTSTEPTKRNNGFTNFAKDIIGDADVEGLEGIKQLPNGNWKCRHKCGNKTKCKHLCCREGLEKPPKPVKGKGSMAQQNVPAEERFPPTMAMLRKQVLTQGSKIATKSSGLKAGLKLGTSALTNSGDAVVFDIPEDGGNPYSEDSGIDNSARLHSQSTPSSLRGFLRKRPINSSPDIPIVQDAPDTDCENLLAKINDWSRESTSPPCISHSRRHHHIDGKYSQTESHPLPRDESPNSSSQTPRSQLFEIGCQPSSDTTVLLEESRMRAPEDSQDLYMLSESSIFQCADIEIVKPNKDPVNNAPLLKKSSGRWSCSGKGDHILPERFGLHKKRKISFPSTSGPGGRDLIETDKRDTHNETSFNTFNPAKIEDESQEKMVRVSPTQYLSEETPVTVLDFLGGCVVYSEIDNPEQPCEFTAENGR